MASHDAAPRLRRHGRLMALARRLAADPPGIREPACGGRLLCLARRGGEPRHVRGRHADGGLSRRRGSRARSLRPLRRRRERGRTARAVPRRRHGRSRRARGERGRVRRAAPPPRRHRRVRPLRRHHDDPAPRGMGGSGDASRNGGDECVFPAGMPRSARARSRSRQGLRRRSALRRAPLRRALAAAVREAAQIRRAAGELRRFLASPQGRAPASA